MAMQGNSGTSGLSEDGVLYYKSRTRLAEITDGMSQTLLFGERPPSFGVDYGWWYAGAGVYGGILDHHLGANEAMRTRYGICNESKLYYRQGALHDECSVSHFWSMHAGGANFAYADGSIHFLEYGIGELLTKLATRAGHEVTAGLD
jgi:prepilin-type processing-associated H-X9-DG protein